MKPPFKANPTNLNTSDSLYSQFEAYAKNMTRPINPPAATPNCFSTRAAAPENVAIATELAAVGDPTGKTPVAETVPEK